MRYHPTPVRMASIKKTNVGKFEKGTLVHYWREYKLVASMENSMVVPQKLKNAITIWIRNSTLGYSSEENGNTNLKSYLQPHVHCSIIYNSQDMETTLVFIRRQMDKEIVAHIFIMEHYSVIKRTKACHVWQNGWISRTLCYKK